MPDTRLKIENALIDLAKTKDADKITVKDVTDRAQVARQTFYRYYLDLPDLMEQILRKVSRDLIERSAAADTAEEILRLFIDEMNRDYDILRRVLASSYRAGAERLLLGAAQETVTAIFREKYPQGDLSAEELAFITDISACTIMTYLLEHFEKRDMSAEEIRGRFLWLIEALARTKPEGS